MPGRYTQTDRLGNQYYDMLPGLWRSTDHSDLASTFYDTEETLKFHNRFLRVFGDAQEEILRAVRGVLEMHDPLSCPENMLEYLASNVAWPLDTDDPVGTQRLICRHIVSLVYRGKHKLDGIHDAIEGIVGIPCEIFAFNNPPDGGIVGESLVGDCDTWLATEYRHTVVGDTGTGFYVGGQAKVCGDLCGPSISDEDRITRFTFEIRVGVVTDEQLKTIQSLAEYMRPSREHYRIEVTP